MALKGLFGFLGLVPCPGLAHAGDCIAVRQSEVSIVREAGCGELEVLSRQAEKSPTIWGEFVQPGNPAEWRYNDWIRRQVALRPKGFAIQSLYRSDRLVSAHYSFGWSVNVDATRWTLFSPDDLVSLGAAANACWRQFADESGEAFTGAWATGRPWVDRDFDWHRFPEVMKEIIGPDVIDPEPSTGRTLRVFIRVLRDQSRWTFSEAGARIDFGRLMGKQAAPFSCSLATADLQAMAQPGAAVPP